MHRRFDMTRANADEVTDLLGEHVDDTVVDRIVNLGASADEIGEALDDLDYERTFGEPREASSTRIEELRRILEEASEGEEVSVPSEEVDVEEDEGLTVVDIDQVA